MGLDGERAFAKERVYTRGVVAAAAAAAAARTNKREDQLKTNNARCSHTSFIVR